MKTWKQSSVMAVTTSSFFHGYFHCKSKTIVLKLGLSTTAFVFMRIRVILVTFCCVGAPDLFRWCAKQHVCNKKLLLGHFSHFNKFYPFATDLIFFSKTEENLITPFAVSPFAFAAQLEFISLIQPVYFSGSRGGLSSQPPRCFGLFFVSCFSRTP